MKNADKQIRRWLAKHPTLSIIGLYIFVSLIASFIFYLRFPNNFIEPNFYAEDGSVYLHNIETSGFLHALFTTFNGYFVSGLYLLEGIGYVLNGIIFHGNFLDLSKSFAVTSYAFLGFVCALPVLLFHRYLKPAALLLIVLFSIFVPLPGYDYAIMGTIGNLKFIFVYVAFLLLIYRHLITEIHWKKFIIIDIAILICAYTNVVVYLLMPFALLRYRDLLRFDKKKLVSLIKLRSFQNLIALGVLLLPQLIVVKLYGIPSIPGYLDTPYEFPATINLFMYRTYLFPFLPHLMNHLNDIIVVVMFVILNASLWIGMKGKRTVYIFGMISALLITLLFVMNRTGVSALFATYLSSGPDQFFYTQNLIVAFLLSIAIVGIMSRIGDQRIRVTIYASALLFIAALYIPTAGSYGKNDFMQRTVKNAYINAQTACAKQNSSTVKLQLYPVLSDAFPLNEPRDRICTDELKAYVPDTEYLQMESQPGTYLPDVASSSLAQTFTSNYDGLSGVSLTFLTYKRAVKDHYDLDIYSSNCKEKLRSIAIAPNAIVDTLSERINFPKIDSSKNKSFCLKLSLQGAETSPLAIALAKDNAYPEGTLTVNGVRRNDDAMLRLHYSK